MNYFLVKSEPSVYSFSRLLEEGSTVWDGIRNHAARLHLLSMKPGDQVLFYHSGEDRAVTGLTKVSRSSYPDPTADDPRWLAVDLSPVKALKRPVSLAEIKKEKRLQNIGLVRIGRLSVMPLKKEEFDLIVNMSK